MSSKGFPSKRREGIMNAISVGAFLVLIGLLFLVHPSLSDKIVAFFQDINVVRALPTESIMLPAPVHVAQHVELYTAVEQFSLAWGVFLVAMLIVRFLSRTSTGSKAENLGDIAFWFGSAYLIQTWLIREAKWFEFWALVVILIGASLIIRGIFLVVAKAFRR